MDIYATNGPGAPDSLFANRLVETGELTFEDVGVEAGVGATDQDSTGVWYGDIDNDETTLSTGPRAVDRLDGLCVR